MYLQTSHTRCWNLLAKGASAVSTRGESAFLFIFLPRFSQKGGGADVWEADEGRRKEFITRPIKS